MDIFVISNFIFLQIKLQYHFKYCEYFKNALIIKTCINQKNYGVNRKKIETREQEENFVDEQLA